MEKDEFFIKRIRELANLSYQRDIVTFSDFLNLNEQNIINDRKNQMPGVVMECFGGYEQAERQMVAFHPDALLFPWKYPIKCLKAEPLAAKFSEDLTHRDFLGAVLNLGIERAVIGDILVQKHTAWIFCHEKIADYIIENLTRVRHTTMKLSMVDNLEHIPDKAAPQAAAPAGAFHAGAGISGDQWHMCFRTSGCTDWTGFSDFKKQYGSFHRRRSGICKWKINYIEWI